MAKEKNKEKTARRKTRNTNKKKKKKREERGREAKGGKKFTKLDPTERTQNGFCWIGVLVDAGSLGPTKGALKCSNSLGI